MEDNTAPILLKEVNVGTTSAPLTHDELKASAFAPASWTAASSPPQPPSLAAAEEQLGILSALLLAPNPHPDVDPQGGIANASQERLCRDEDEPWRQVRVEAVELTRIASIVDALGPFQRWAREEGAHYQDEPSAIAQVGAPRAIVACLLTRRPRIHTAALLVMKEMLRHPQSCSETLRAADTLLTDAPCDSSDEDGADDEPLDEDDGKLPRLLARLIRRARGVEGLCVATVSCAAALADAARTHAFCARHLSADSFLTGSLVSEVLGAVQQHSASTELRVATAHLLASVATLPRRCEDAEAEAPPAAVLLCHVGSVLETMLSLLRESNGVTALRQHVLSFLRACAVHPVNRIRLLQSGGYAAVAQSLCPVARDRQHRHGHTRVDDWDSFSAAAEAMAYFAAYLDSWQRRRYVQVVRYVLTRWGEERRVRLGLVMLLALLQAMKAEAARAPPSLQPPVLHGAFAAYALYPQPPRESTVEATVLSSQHVDPEPRQRNATVRRVQLRESGDIPSQADTAEDTIAFLRQCLIPQLLSHVIDHFTEALAYLGEPSDSYERGDKEENEHRDECEEAEERALYTRVVALAERCLSELMRPVLR